MLKHGKIPSSTTQNQNTQDNSTMRKESSRYIHNTTSISFTSHHTRSKDNKQHRKISVKVGPEEDMIFVLRKARTLAIKIVHQKSEAEIQHLQPPKGKDLGLHIWVN